MGARFSFVLTTLLASSPAFAEGSTPLPEGSNLALFAIGIAGVLIGRKASSRNRD
jgi:hypothetical protein